MKNYFILLLITALLFVGSTGTAYSQATDNAKGMAMCDRIEKQGMCEEYRLSTLSAADRQLITKHCTTDALCPTEDRIGICLRYRDPDDIIFDKHYYRNVDNKEDWHPEFIEETCIKNNGRYEAN